MSAVDLPLTIASMSGRRRYAYPLIRVTRYYLLHSTVAKSGFTVTQRRTGYAVAQELSADQAHAVLTYLDNIRSTVELVTNRQLKRSKRLAADCRRVRDAAFRAAGVA